MLKQLLVATALVTATGTALANSAPYVGIGTGIIVNSSNHVDMSDYRGMPLNVFAGFGGIITQNFYLAGELFGTLTSGDLSNNANLRTTYSYGAAIIPGLLLSDRTLAYLRAGVLQSHFTTTGGETVTGGQLGLGVQLSLTQSVDIRGEYDYIFYRAFYAHDYFGHLSSTSPRSDQFNLSLIYKFN